MFFSRIVALVKNFSISFFSTKMTTHFFNHTFLYVLFTVTFSFFQDLRFSLFDIRLAFGSLQFSNSVCVYSNFLYSKFFYPHVFKIKLMIMLKSFSGLNTRLIALSCCLEAIVWRKVWLRTSSKFAFSDSGSKKFRMGVVLSIETLARNKFQDV